MKRQNDREGKGGRGREKDGRSSEQSGLAFALYMQSVKKCYVRETDAVRLKVTTWCIGEARERESERDRGRERQRPQWKSARWKLTPGT